MYQEAAKILFDVFAECDFYVLPKRKAKLKHFLSFIFTELSTITEL